MARAAMVVHERLIRQHEDRGVSFLLPMTTWVDLDVRIGADTLVYPGCVLEGATVIGSECGPMTHSRLIEAHIGRGAELKGWNYVARTSIRNHAVLEPHERRGLD
jgi:bifunctional UDP-N-acetylglucosamine pyrophosphorylase/glucosamine-1-phosphate N-acetyltransferase